MRKMSPLYQVNFLCSYIRSLWSYSVLWCTPFISAEYLLYKKDAIWSSPPFFLIYISL